MNNEIEAWKTYEVTCPYCNFEYSDSWEFSMRHDGDATEMECEGCGKNFHVRLDVERSYTSSGLCKENKSKHNWQYHDFISKSDGERCYGRKCLTCGKFESNVERDINSGGKE